MSGTRFLFISKDEQVFKITKPKDGIFQAIPQLSGQEVLEVILIYETKDRKPNRLLYVSFDRMQLDTNGQFVLNEQEFYNRSRNFSLFALQTSDTLGKTDDPLPIPTAIVVPTKSEKECLKQYIRENMPQLYSTAVQIIEREIKSRMETNLNNQKLVKEAARIKNSNK